MKVTNYDRLMNEINDALQGQFKTIVCDYVEFHDQFPVSRTYNRTVSVENRFYITYNKDEQEIQFFDTAKTWNDYWYTTYPLDLYSKMELAIYLYKRIERLLEE